MSKYITELANDIAKSCPDLVENGCGNDNCVGCLAFKLIGLGYQKQEWISVDERLPTVEEEERGLVGIVNGHNGKIRFTDAIIFVNYDFDEKEWWSEDYDLTNCKVEYWMPLPEPPEMKGGAEGTRKL